MADLVRGHTVRCFDVTLDRYGRTVARRFADDTNLPVAMVRAGMARAFVQCEKTIARG
jgi:endonuclease YncB( thermonuclease family)